MNAVNTAINIDTDYNNITPNIKEDDKQERPNFVKRVDKKTMLEIIDNSLEDYNNYLQYVNFGVNENIEDNTNNKNVVIINNAGTNNINKYVSNVNIKYFKPMEDELFITNPAFNFLKIIEGRRNLYFQNEYRGIYRYKFSSIYEDDIFKLNCIDYLFTPTYGKLDCCYDFGTDIKHYVNLDLFNEIRAYDYLKSVEQDYKIDECKKINFTCNVPDIQNKYKIITIPKDIMKLFYRITANHKEALKYLKLDEKTGYYCYEYDEKTKIPVICKHQIMLLDGVNTVDIANECYKNGCCKYCGQEMIAYNQTESIVLHPSAVSLIILFSECFKENISSDEIIYIVYDFIIKRLEKDNINIYSNDQCIGYTCLYLLKLINLCRPVLKMIDYKIRTLINKISNNLSILGKSEQDVKTLLESDMFGDVENVVTLLKSESMKSKDIDISAGVIAEDVLFNSMTNREAKTEIQKMYINNKYKLYELCILLEKEYNKLYNVSKYRQYDLNDVATHFFNTIQTKINNIGFIFFNLANKYYCPINIIHEFKKDVCIHCKLNKDGSNIDKIYNNFSNIINSSSIEEPNTLTIKERDKKTHEIIIDNICKSNISDFRDILLRYNITYTEINILENSFKTFNKEYFTMASTIIDIDYDELISPLQKDIKINDYIKQIFKYIINRNLINEDVMVNILYSCYNNIENIELLL